MKGEKEMGKKLKNFTKFEKRLFKEIEERDWVIRKVLRQFYPNGELEEFTFPGVRENSFDCCYKLGMIFLDGMSEKERLDDQKDKMERCAEIRQNIQEGKA